MTNNTSEEIKLPKLDASGKEWTTWKLRLQLVVASRGLSGYLNGMKAKPIDPATGKSVGWMATTSDEIAAVEAYEKNLPTWFEKDLKVKHIIVGTIPNSLLIHLVNKDTSFEYYNTLKNLFKNRSLVISAEL